MHLEWLLQLRRGVARCRAAGLLFLACLPGLRGKSLFPLPLRPFSSSAGPPTGAVALLRTRLHLTRQLQIC